MQEPSGPHLDGAPHGHGADCATAVRSGARVDCGPCSVEDASEGQSRPACSSAVVTRDDLVPLGAESGSGTLLQFAN